MTQYLHLSMRPPPPARVARSCQLGAAFDYNIHNAIMRENTNEYKEDEVCKVTTSTRMQQP